MGTGPFFIFIFERGRKDKVKKFSELIEKQNEVLKGRFKITKSDDDRRLAFGWASVSIRADGELTVGTLPVGWWIGFKVTDSGVWEKVKDGTYTMFSIEGEAERIEIDEA